MLMKLFLEVKNNSINITEIEIIKKIRHLQNILMNKVFIEAFKNKTLSNKIISEVKKEVNIVANKEDRKILIFKSIINEDEKTELIKKFKIKKIRKLTAETEKEWKNLENDNNKEKNIKRFKKTIEENIEPGDVLLINGETGITFDIVGWAKETGIIAIYEFKKEEDNFLTKTEFREY